MSMKLHGKIWLEDEGQVLFGRGRYFLLKGIQDYGSLAETARHLGMSYRAAWGRLRTSEDRLGLKLVEKGPGQGRGQTLQLTELSRKLIDLFDRLEEEFNAFLKQHSEGIQRELEADAGDAD